MMRIIDDGSPLGKLAFQIEMPVRWGDLDAARHVNNTVVLRYIEEARMQWVVALKLNELVGCIPVVASLACSFIKPIQYPETIKVEVYCGRMGRSSIELAYALNSAEDPTRQYARACTVWVWTDGSTGRPIPVPDVLRKFCRDDEQTGGER